MKIKKLLSLCVLFASVLSFSSCDSETSGTYTTLAFVNYGGSGDNGSVRFIYSEPNSDKTLTLYSRVSFLEGKTPEIGTRLIGRFSLDYGVEIKDGMTLDCTGISTLNAYGDVAVENINENPQSAPLYIKSLMRCGNYLDLYCLASYNAGKMKVVCDASTLDSDSPVLYLVYEMDNPDTISEVDYFASFNISSIINRPNVKKIKLVTSNNNGEKTLEYEIRK
ncbi:MAG: hypothetical protein K2M11_05840 [Paramuribaculum sp.]|nr:hypothetical protein [Paramuribaculum sp.]